MTGLYIALAIGFIVISSVIAYGLKEATKAKVGQVVGWSGGSVGWVRWVGGSVGR